MLLWVRQWGEKTEAAKGDEIVRASDGKQRDESNWDVEVKG